MRWGSNSLQLCHCSKTDHAGGPVVQMTGGTIGDRQGEYNPCWTPSSSRTGEAASALCWTTPFLYPRRRTVKLTEVPSSAVHLTPSSASNKVQGEVLQSHPYQCSKHTSLSLKGFSTKEFTTQYLHQQVPSPDPCAIGKLLTFHTAPRKTGCKDLVAKLEGTGTKRGEESQRDVL